MQGDVAKHKFQYWSDVYNQFKKRTKVYPPHIFLLLSKWSNYVDCRMWNVDFLFVARSTGAFSEPLNLCIKHCVYDKLSCWVNHWIRVSNYLWQVKIVYEDCMHSCVKKVNKRQLKNQSQIAFSDKSLLFHSSYKSYKKLV